MFLTRILGGSLAFMGLLCGYLYIQLQAEQLHSAKLEKRNIEFAAEVKTKTLEQQARDLAHARAIEATQAKVSQEVSNDYQKRLAALRAKYDSLLAKGSANPGRTGETHLPGAPISPSGPDATATPDLFACEANSLQLDALQQWIRSVLRPRNES